MPTYSVKVMFTTNTEDADDLPNEQVVADEVRSWLDSLRAFVHSVSVETLIPPPTCGEEAQ